MRRTFDIPLHYRSPIIAGIKALQKERDPGRRTVAPTVLDLGPVNFLIPRHFGFCYGVENAIEIAYRTLEENPGRRVFLLSEMIHNPHVNADLVERGVRFLMTTSGEQLVPWEELTPEDVVIVPAFGTTLAIEETLRARGIDPYRWNTTCPFVEKVWNRSTAIGARGFTIVVHGKRAHEETRATASHAAAGAPVVVVQNMEETERLAAIITGAEPVERFAEWFGSAASEGFDPKQHLGGIGVVNQTTMLADETQAIADRLRRAMVERYGEENVRDHFADTRDTLCYATNENQSATLALASTGADLAVVVGGYNSSNTGHLVEILERTIPTWFVKDAGEIVSQSEIRHFDLHTHEVRTTLDWFPTLDRPLTVALTGGASCPDALVDDVLERIAGFFPGAITPAEALERMR